MFVRDVAEALAETLDGVRGAVLAAGKKSAAALQSLATAYQAGCRDPLCLRWLAAAHLDARNLADVEMVAAEWERHEPGNLEVARFVTAGKRLPAGHSPDRSVDS